MEYRLLRPFFIIGVHPACFLFHNRRFSQNHKRTFIPQQHLHQAGTHTIGRQDQPVRLFLQNQLLHGRYTHTAVIIGYQQIITVCLGHFFNGIYTSVKKGIGKSSFVPCIHNQAYTKGASIHQIPGKAVRMIIHLLHHLQDPAFCLFRNRCAPVYHPGNGGWGHPHPFGNVLDCYAHMYSSH